MRTLLLTTIVLLLGACRREPTPALRPVEDPVATAVVASERVAPAEGSSPAAVVAVKSADELVRIALGEGRLPSGDGPLEARLEPAQRVLAPPPAAVERWIRGEHGAIETLVLQTVEEPGETASALRGAGVVGVVPNVLITPIEADATVNVGALVLAPFGMTESMRPALVQAVDERLTVLFTGSAITPATQVDADAVRLVEPLGVGSTVACEVGEELVINEVLARFGERALMRAAGGATIARDVAGCHAVGVAVLPAIGERVRISTTTGIVADGEVVEVDAAHARVGVQVTRQGRRSLQWGTRAELLEIADEIEGSGR